MIQEDILMYLIWTKVSLIVPFFPATQVNPRCWAPDTEQLDPGSCSQLLTVPELSFSLSLSFQFEAFFNNSKTHTRPFLPP